MRHKKIKYNYGFGIIEIVVAVTVITLSLFAITSVANSALGFNDRIFLSTKAGFLLEEGSEGIRMMRDSNWSNISALSTSTPYYLYFSTTTPNSWKATTTRDLIDGVFYRTFSVNDARRDGSDRIAASGAVDLNTKKIDMTVSWWNGKATSSKAVIFYLANIFN